MKKKNADFVVETEEQKKARWIKSSKLAKSFAKQAGVYGKAISERKRNRKDRYGEDDY